MVCGMSGFHTGLGVFTRAWVQHLLQAGDRRAMRAVDLEGHQIVAPHAGAPGAVDLRDDAAVKRNVA